MAKFSRAVTRPAPQSPVRTVTTAPDTVTAQGGPGFSRDPRSELFLLAVTNMVGEDTFYESAGDRDNRFRDLIHTVVADDPAWVARLIPFMRSEMNLRSASVVAAAEYALAVRNPHNAEVAVNGPSVRSVIASAMARADEPAEFIGYWIQRTGRRTLPGGVQRGVADAVARLYTERAALKYDGGSRGIRMGDVIEMTHPTPRMFDGMTLADLAHARNVDPETLVTKLDNVARSIAATGEYEGDLSHAQNRTFVYEARIPQDPGGWRLRNVAVMLSMDPADVLDAVVPKPSAWQGDLFTWLLGQRHRGTDNTASVLALPMITANTVIRQRAAEDREGLRRSLLANPEVLSGAGVTWEFLSGLGPMDKEAWEAVIPSMGYMALLRNLRNFDQAGVSDEVAAQVAARLSNPEEVARSRQFPFRFLSAYRAAPSLRWSWALEKALNLSLANIPSFPGNTLVLVDRSPSMFWDKLSAKSDLTRADGAAVFGSAVALRAANADLIQFGEGTRSIPFTRSDSVLRVIDRFGQINGTDITGAVRRHYQPGHHTRVVIVTDEMQGRFARAMETVDAIVPVSVPVHVWNLGGYAAAFSPSGGNRHTFGGLADGAFKMAALVEAGRSQDWNAVFGV